MKNIKTVINSREKYLVFIIFIKKYGASKRMKKGCKLEATGSGDTYGKKTQYLERFFILASLYIA